MILNSVLTGGSSKLTDELRSFELNADAKVTDVLDELAKIICGVMWFHRDGRDFLYITDMFCLYPGEKQNFTGESVPVNLSFASDGKSVTLDDNETYVSASECLYYAIR